MKKVVSLVMVICMLFSMSFAFADDAAVPSVTIGTVVLPEGVTEAGDAGLVVYLAPMQENKVETKVFENIVKTVEETSVQEYFGEEVMKEVAAFLPVEVLPEGIEKVETLADLENVNIHIDEFFVLGEEGYDVEYGDLDVTFEFATKYEDDTVLVAMIGVLPEDCKVEYEEGEELEEGLEIQWIPVETTVFEGKVQVKMTEEILSIISARNVVFTLLRVDNEITEEAAE